MLVDTAVCVFKENIHEVIYNDAVMAKDGGWHNPVLARAVK